jgi:CrcB protein
MTALLVALGALVGAPLRYLTDRFVQSRHRGILPWGTFSVNMVASFGLGVLAGASVSTATAALVGTGLCGTLSTYSTFSYETMRLGADGRRLLAAANVGGSLIFGFAAAALGWYLGSLLG